MATIVQLDNRRAGPVEPLDALIALVEDDLKAVNQTIVDRMHSPVALIPQLAGHIVAAGGKRLRPILTLASSEACGGNPEDALPLACSVECLHTYSLIHEEAFIIFTVVRSPWSYGCGPNCGGRFQR